MQHTHISRRPKCILLITMLGYYLCWHNKKAIGWHSETHICRTSLGVRHIIVNQAILSRNSYLLAICSAVSRILYSCLLDNPPFTTPAIKRLLISLKRMLIKETGVLSLSLLFSVLAPGLERRGIIRRISRPIQSHFQFLTLHQGIRITDLGFISLS
jgi:hypothetical protein